ncbi:MAG: alpha/beta fold hydrolase [Phycisphaerales bacterium]|jgi:predicted alpha/beta-fold hydrolase|nr:alpha/beta fold hydrolase [Phycisphaerales bacterium]
MHPTRAWRHYASGLGFYANLTLLLCLTISTPGCFFSERSFPIDPSQTARSDTSPNLPARQWLIETHNHLKKLLPSHRNPTLLTGELSDKSDRPINMVARYSLKPDQLQSIFVNFLGLSYSAQATGADMGHQPAPNWPGFIDVWTPINPNLKLAGRLGMARDANGKIISADCIVLLPGLCGGNNVIRQQNLAEALKNSGLHVLAIETRAQGQTAVGYPNVPSTWGICESSDLLIVSDWLTAKPNIKRTGLIGFSWGGTIAMLTAWSEERSGGHPGVAPQIERILPKLPPRRRYQAGIMAFSPVLDLDVLIDKLSTPQGYLTRPAWAGLQRTIKNWKARSGFPKPTGTLDDVIRCKELDYKGTREDQRRFLRFISYKDKPADNKLENIRVPLLIVHAADDPIAPVQTVADLTARVKNPNLATIVLPTGGHIGFAPYARDWFYSLTLSYFDPQKGPKPSSTTQSPAVR